MKGIIVNEYVKVFTWDWKEQPPMKDIAIAIQELSVAGFTIHLQELNTGGDWHTWVVSDQELTNTEMWQAYDN